MYEKGDRPVIHKAGPKDDCEMLIEVNEKLSSEVIDIPADLVVLMVGMEAREDSHEIARIVNISQDKEGWFIESHPKLEPVATTTDGIFIAGTCVAPKDIPDTVAQARAAAARILARIAKEKIEVDAIYSDPHTSLFRRNRESPDSFLFLPSYYSKLNLFYIYELLICCIYPATGLIPGSFRMFLSDTTLPS